MRLAFTVTFAFPCSGYRGVLAAAWLWSSTSLAQVSLELDEKRRDAAEADAADDAAAGPTVAAEPKAEITPPTWVEGEVSYPDGATGDERVELELLVLADGTVSEARVVRGAAPFDEAARHGALQFRFQPATRNGKPTAARVRFLITFDEPEKPPSPDEANATGQETEGSEPTVGSASSKRTSSEQLEVLVLGEREGLSEQMSQAEIRQLPGAFGDPFRAIEVLPGVTPIVSGIPYFYVRGAPPGNTGYYFDGVVVPTLYHFAGGPGVLHPALVDRVDLYAGAYPARFGRYAGGIVVGSLEQPEDRFRGEASLRLTDAGAMVEVPFADGRGSVFAAGRYSYTALVLSLLVPELTINYWDYQTRARYQVDHDDAIEVLWFGSNDFATSEVTVVTDQPDGTQRVEKEEQRLADLTFHRVDLRWQRTFPRGDFQQALMLGYDLSGAGETSNFESFLVGTRSNLRHRLTERARLHTGMDVLVETQNQRFDEPIGSDPPPGPISPEPEPQPAQDPSETLGLGFDSERTDATTGIFAELSLDATERTEVTLGLRGDVFVAGNDVALGIDPRVAARFSVSEDLTLVHGLGVSHQAPSFVVPIPGLKPNLRGGLQRAFQHSAGAEYALPWDVRSSLTFFHNLFFNMTDLFGVATLGGTAPENVDVGHYLRTNGRAVGFELALRRSLTHRLGGFLSYTLSRSERYSGPLEGPAGSDRTHVLNLAASYDLGKHWRVGGRVVLYSGVPAVMETREEARSPQRTSPFWRIDWRVQKRWPSADGRRYWGFVLELLNTTLNEESIQRVCRRGLCEEQTIGPITIPSIGLEAGF